MKCPNCPKPSDVDFGTLAVPRGVPTYLGQFFNSIYNNYNDITELSHFSTPLGLGQLGQFHRRS